MCLTLTNLFIYFLFWYRKIGSNFCRKEKNIQANANTFVQSVINSAEKKAGTIQDRSNNNYMDRKEQEKSNRQSNSQRNVRGAQDDDIGPETDYANGHNRDDRALFRSGSITAEDFDGSYERGYFIPDDDTEDMLNTCFPDLFTENGGSESIPNQQCEREILKRYGQLFEYFGEQTREGKIVKRSSLKKYFGFLCENWIKKDVYSRSLCISYIQQVSN